MTPVPAPRPVRGARTAANSAAGNPGMGKTMNMIRTIDRWVPHWGLWAAPSAQLVSVLLIESGGRYYTKTPWAMLDAPAGRDTDDSQMAASVGPCFAREADALQWAGWQSPHWAAVANDAIRCRLHDAERWHGEFSGRNRLADACGVDVDYLLKVVRGEKLASPGMVRAARAWKGGK